MSEPITGGWADCDLQIMSAVLSSELVVPCLDLISPCWAAVYSLSWSLPSQLSPMAKCFKAILFHNTKHHSFYKKKKKGIKILPFISFFFLFLWGFFFSLFYFVFHFDSLVGLSRELLSLDWGLILCVTITFLLFVFRLFVLVMGPISFSYITVRHSFILYFYFCFTLTIILISLKLFC